MLGEGPHLVRVRTCSHSAQVKKATWVPLSDAAADSCGAKAAACAALEHAAGGKLFETPKGAVIPFGNMELALKAKPQPSASQCMHVSTFPPTDAALATMAAAAAVPLFGHTNILAEPMLATPDVD